MVKGSRLLASATLLLSCGSVTAHSAPTTCRERLLPSEPERKSRRAIIAEDLIELRDFGTVSQSPGREPFSLSPDGKYAALTLRRADAGADSYCTGIMLIPLDGRSDPKLVDVGGEVIPSTTDVHGVAAIPSGLPLPAAPAWSPDGKTLAFLRRDGGATRIWTVGLDGGPARQIGDPGAEPLTLAWGPDRNSLLFTARDLSEASDAAIEQEGKRGFFYDERFWPTADLRPHARSSAPIEHKILDLRTGAMSELTAPVADMPDKPSGTKQLPKGAGIGAFAGGDGAWVALDRTDRPRGSKQLHVERDGREVACSAAICRAPIANLFWQEPGTLLILSGPTPENGGRSAVYRWRVERERGPVRLLETEDWLTSCLLAEGKLICAREGLAEPRALVRVDLQSGNQTLVYDPNPEFSQIRLGRAERMTWTDRNGVRTYGDLVLPPSHKPGQRHPLVVVQYWSRGFLRGGIADEFPIQLMAARGYAVFSFQMPSDSVEASEQADSLSAQRVKVKDWAGRARNFTALEAGIDAVIARGVVDPDAIAITGISDGASTVQFALNNSTRFKAAIIGGCCDEPSINFTAGPGYGASAAAFGYPPPGDDGREFWRRQSLALNAARMRVPLLMHIADNEARIALETFAALKSHGAPVEMYIFPNEWHTKSHPAHRLAIYSRNIAWLDFWLRNSPSAAPDRAEEIARWQKLRSDLKRRAGSP